MFTGLVREIGTVRSMDDGRLVLETTLDAELGDSIAIDGVCLTVVEATDGTLAFEAVPGDARAERARRARAWERRVNLEPALRAGDPLGGHIVQGHVDGVASVAAVTPEGDGRPHALRRGARAPPLRRREGLGRRAGDEPDRRRRRRRRLRGGPDPAHARGDHARQRSSPVAGSTSRSTCSRSTSRSSSLAELLRRPRPERQPVAIAVGDGELRLAPRPVGEWVDDLDAGILQFPVVARQRGLLEVQRVR